MRTGAHRMQTAVAAIVIACLMWSPMIMGMPVPSQAPQTALPNPCSGGGDGFGVIGLASFLVGLPAMIVGIRFLADGSDSNDKTGKVWLNLSVTLFISGIVIMASDS